LEDERGEGARGCSTYVRRADVPRAAFRRVDRRKKKERKRERKREREREKGRERERERKRGTVTLDREQRRGETRRTYIRTGVP